MNKLMELPKCPRHGTQMLYQEARTPEQKYCGAWYNCKEPGCSCSTLISSKEIRDLYKIQIGGNYGKTSR